MQKVQSSQEQRVKRQPKRNGMNQQTIKCVAEPNLNSKKLDQLENVNTNDNPTLPFFNPICQQTYKALPRIYGCNKKKQSLINSINQQKIARNHNFRYQILDEKCNQKVFSHDKIQNKYPPSMEIQLNHTPNFYSLKKYGNFNKKDKSDIYIPAKIRGKCVAGDLSINHEHYCCGHYCFQHSNKKQFQHVLSPQNVECRHQSDELEHGHLCNKRTSNKLEEEQLNLITHQQAGIISKLKLVNQASSNRLSQPKVTHVCRKKHCLCFSDKAHQIETHNHSGDNTNISQMKHFRRNKQGSQKNQGYSSKRTTEMRSYKKISKIKLPQLIQIRRQSMQQSDRRVNKFARLPDDGQSMHKVLKTQPNTSVQNFPSGLDSLIGYNRHMNGAAYHPKHENQNKERINSQQFAQQKKQNSDNEENARDKTIEKKHNIDQQIQVNLQELHAEKHKKKSINQKPFIGQYSQSQRNQYSSETDSQKQDKPAQIHNIKQKSLQQSKIKNGKGKQKQRYKPKFRQGRYKVQNEQNEINNRQDSERDNQIQKKRAKKNNFEAQPSQIESLQHSKVSRKSDSASLSSFFLKSNQRKNTQFHALNRKQESMSKISSSNKSRVRSILSNGLFRIPQEDQYASYISKYTPMDKQFKIRQIAKRDSFQIVPFNKGIYFGQVHNQMKHGQGLLLTQKQIFQGKFNNNIRYSGCERSIDGIYRGGYLNGKRSGHGTFEWHNGEIFEGQWREGTKNGHGIWKSPRGDYYQGQWLLSRQHGIGIFKHKTSTYRGQFRNYLKHGKGQQKFSSGDRYEGQYFQGKPHGKGIYEWSQGGYYIGSFEKGLRQGEGKWVDGAGNVYEGTFKNDFKHGQGVQIFKSGERFEGIFNEGVQQKGRIYGTDGCIIQVK